MCAQLTICGRTKLNFVARIVVLVFRTYSICLIRNTCLQKALCALTHGKILVRAYSALFSLENCKNFNFRFHFDQSRIWETDFTSREKYVIAGCSSDASDFRPSERMWNFFEFQLCNARATLTPLLELFLKQNSCSWSAIWLHISAFICRKCYSGVGRSPFRHENRKFDSASRCDQIDVTIFISTRIFTKLHSRSSAEGFFFDLKFVGFTC